MSSDNQSARSYADQLSEFESQLSNTSHEIDLEPDVFRTIRELITRYKDSDKDIRRIVKERYDAGKLREEKLHLVQQVVTGLTSEHVNTVPDDERTAEFSQTVVLPPSAATASSPQPKRDPDPLQPGSILRDRFMLQQRISGGSMGVVYKALDRRMAEVEGMERWVAIKVLTTKLSRNADALRAMQQEAAKGRSVSHPNIVRFIDLDREDDVYFIVMEWIDGRSLAAVLDDPETRDISIERSLNILRQLGGALEYAHRCGVVHADVKPGNVMLTPGDRVKLIDFGVARIRPKDGSPADRFDPKVLGAATPAYSSMQVLTGEDPVPADDVFSLACVAYRLCAGRRAFGAKNAAEAAEEGLTPERPEGLSDNQWRALKKALSFARIARYNSPHEFVDAMLEKGESVNPSDSVAAIDMPHVFEPPEAVEAPESFESFGKVDAAQNLEAGQKSAPMAFVLPDERGGRTESSFVLDADEAGSIYAPGSGTERWPQVILAAVLLAVLVGLAIRYDWLDGRLPEPVEENLAVGEGAIDAPGPTEAVELPAARSETEPAASASASETPSSMPAPAVDEVAPQEQLGTPLSSYEAPAENDPFVAAVDEPEAQPDGFDMSGDDNIDVQAVDEFASAPNVRDLPQFDARQPDTVGFIVDQITIGEGEIAVQIDVQRYQPSNTVLSVPFVVRDVTAGRDEDYFPPVNNTIRFAAGELTARLLMPLVQDAEAEADETFYVELNGGDAELDSDIIRRIAVTIRDDDS